MANKRQTQTEQIVRFLSGTKQLTGVNTYTEAAIPTGITPEGGYGFRILDVEVAADMAGSVFSGALYAGIEMQLTKESVGAMIGFDDARVLAYLKRDSVTGSAIANDGTIFSNEWPWELNMSGEVLTVSPNLYLGLDSFGATAQITFNYRVYYDLVKLSELEILRILQG